jgi:hypothetical protein
MIIELIKLASDLDTKGHMEEADALDAVITKMADEDYHFGFDPDEMVDLLPPDPRRAIKELHAATSFALDDEDLDESMRETFYNFYRIIKPFIEEKEL